MFFKKRIITFLILIVCVQIGLSQQYSYCNVYEHTNKTISIKFANNPTYISKEYQKSILTDIETQKPIVFNNGIDAVNHLSLYGWELCNTTPQTDCIIYTLRHIIESNYQIGGRIQRDMRIMEQYEKTIK